MSKADNALNTSERAAPTRHTSATHYDIKTVTGLVEALGGEEAAAEEFDITTQAVREWEISGHIPTGRHLRLFAMASALGKTISPSVVGLLDDDEEAVALSDLMRAARRPEEGGDNV